jgi:hypothetical protein
MRADFEIDAKAKLRQLTAASKNNIRFGCNVEDDDG